jgi:hypothetical protein
MAHPNTVAAGLSGGFGTLAVYLLNKYAGTHLNQVDGAAIATGAAAVVLYIGRRGIRGTLAAILAGTPAPKKTARKPAA